ncbi:translation initiation factor eIF4A [Gamsiella multidivaricata]|nr:translation initiation factor eIF4A [Gamsiella multidivaricata]
MANTNSRNRVLPPPNAKAEAKVVDDFDNMGFKPELLRGIYAYGLERPSTTEKQLIPPILQGRDVVAQVPLCIIETNAFIIPVLQRLDTSNSDCQALILAPTHELAQQVQKVVIALSDFMKVRCHVSIGGTNIREDAASLTKGCHIVVGTPGRVFDMINRGALKTDSIKMLVLCCADDMSINTQNSKTSTFRQQISDVFLRIPRSSQVVLLLEDTPANAAEVAAMFTRDPVQISMEEDKWALLVHVKQRHIGIVREERKLDILCELLKAEAMSQTIIFCKSRGAVDWLTEKMTAREFTVSAVHGNMEVAQRNVIMKEFRAGSWRVLIATDQLTSSENYFRRIARGGHYEHRKLAISFVTANDTKMLKEIEEFYSVQISEAPMSIDDLL